MILSPHTLRSELESPNENTPRNLRSIIKGRDFKRHTFSYGVFEMFVIPTDRRELRNSCFRQQGVFLNRLQLASSC